MGKTTQVAADRAYDQTKTVLPAEVAQGVYMQNAPGLAALKLMHLKIGTAGGRMADDVQHTMSLANIRKIDGMDNHTRASITPLFAELAAAVLIHDDTEKKRVRIGGMVDDYTQNGSADDPSNLHGLSLIHRVSDTPETYARQATHNFCETGSH
jgi:hypothetical protein